MAAPNAASVGKGNPEILNSLDAAMIAQLDPFYVEFYNANIAGKPATHQVPLAEVRANPAKWRGAWCRDYSEEPGVKNATIQSQDGFMVSLRIYHPEEAVWGPGPYPAHINFHGGGFVFGDLTVDAEWCMTLRKDVGAVVIDVDYRLCPENQFGKCIEDGWAALMWAREKSAELNVNPSSISIGGISAGGQLACVVQHMARDARILLKLAVLSVPTTDYTTYFPFPDGAVPFPSVAAMANAPLLTASRLEFFRQNVFVEEHREIIKKLPLTWRAPLHGENFKGLCDTFLATAECDPLVDEGEAYGLKIVAAGGKVTFRRYLGVPHPFMHSMVLSQARMYNDDICAALKLAHSN